MPGEQERDEIWILLCQISQPPSLVHCEPHCSWYHGRGPLRTTTLTARRASYTFMHVFVKARTFWLVLNNFKGPSTGTLFCHSSVKVSQSVLWELFKSSISPIGLSKVHLWPLMNILLWSSKNNKLRNLGVWLASVQVNIWAAFDHLAGRSGSLTVSLRSKLPLAQCLLKACV